MGANKRALSARWHGAAVLVILGIATSWLVNPVAADAVCSEEEGPLSCEACREGADVNAVSGLPRMSFSGAFVSSNQGEFDWVKCTADECEYWNAEDASNNAPATSPASYLQSVGMFAAVSVVMAVLSPLFITCCCLWRMCGCCGGWTPTYWMTKTGNPRCCKCGFRRRLNPLLADEDKFAYPTLQVTLIRIFAICVAILLFVFIAVGQQMGNVAFTDSMERLALAPSDTVDTIRKLITPGHKLVVDIASHTLVPTMEDINKTLTDAIDIPVLVGAAQCIIDRAVVPPALQELVDAVLHIVNLKDTIVEMDPDVQRIFDQVDNVTTAIGDNVPLLDVLLDELEASKTNLTSKLTALVSDLGNLDTQVDKFLAPGTGIAAISHDIVNASSSESYPSSSQLSTTANGGAGTASIAQLIDPASPMVGVENSPQRTQLIDNLEVFAARFGALPNTTMTVYNLQALETVRSDMVQANTISTTDKLLYTISEDLKLVPASARADVPINAVLNALFALNTTEIRELVVFLNTTVNLIPNVEEFNGLVDDVFELAEILPCVDDVIPSILAVDEQILVLPSFVHEIRNMTVDVKKMIETARNQTREVGKQLEFVEVERKRIDFDSIDNMIDDIKSTKKSANESFSDVLTETKKLDSSKSFSFADIRGNLGSVQSTLENPDLTPKHSTLNALRSAEDTRITLYDLLVDVANSITTFAKGRCSGTTTACENDGECAGTCEFAQKQCSDTTAACTGESNDNSCPTGYCLFEKAKYETLQAALAGFSVPDFDAGSLQSQLDSLNNELKGLNLDAPIANVTDLKNDLNDVPIASAREKLSEVDAERARVDGNFSDVITGWNGIKDNTDKIPAPDGVKKDLDSLQSSVKQLEDFRKQTTTFRDLLSALRTFLYETLPPLFDDMAPGVLNARFEKEGILGTYRAMIDFAKNITSFLSEQQQLFNNAMNSTSGNLTLTEDLDDVSKDIEPQLEVLSQNKYFENGPYYFLASIMDYDTVDPSYTGVDRVFFNKQGKRYPGDKLCVTKGCITNTVRFVNRKPLSEVMEAYNVSGVGVPLTREQMSGVPYIFPGITALLLFLVAVCRCPRKSRWQRCPTCLTGCCMFCTIPIAFFLAGFFFTFVVIGADTCRGGVNVGYQIMTQKPNIVDMCDSLSAPLSSNNAQACNMSVGDDYVDVDIPGMYSDLFGGCSSEQAAWNTMLSDLAGKYTDIPVREVNKTLNDMGDGEFSPRPNMKTNVLDGARRAGTAASNFIDNVNGVLSCSELNGDFAAYKEAICCDFMTAAYWAIGSWNLIAWIMCCCGVPACCLGYKRFPKRPWGSDYKSQINYERIAQQDKDREDQRLAGGAMLQMVHMAPSHPGAGSMASQQPPVGQPNPAWGHGKVDQPSAGTPPYQQLHHGKANNGKGQRLV